MYTIKKYFFDFNISKYSNLIEFHAYIECGRASANERERVKGERFIVIECFSLRVCYSALSLCCLPPLLLLSLLSQFSFSIPWIRIFSRLIYTFLSSLQRTIQFHILVPFCALLSFLPGYCAHSISLFRRSYFFFFRKRTAIEQEISPIYVAFVHCSWTNNWDPIIICHMQARSQYIKRSKCFISISSNISFKIVLL